MLVKNKTNKQLIYGKYSFLAVSKNVKVIKIYQDFARVMTTNVFYGSRCI